MSAGTEALKKAAQGAAAAAASATTSTSSGSTSGFFPDRVLDTYSTEVLAICVTVFALIITAVAFQFSRMKKASKDNSTKASGKKTEEPVWEEDSGRPVRGSKVEERLSLIENCSLFEKSNEKQKRDLAEACQMRHFKPKDVMIVQGKVGDCMYIIKEGYALVTIGTEKHPTEGMQVDRKKPGAYFGEVALLCDVTRTANVLAEDKLECMVISRADFKSAMPDEVIKKD